MSPSPLDWFGSAKSVSSGALVRAEQGGVAVGRDLRDSTIIIKRGVDEDEISRLLAGALGPVAERVLALADQVAREKGIPERPLRAILVKLGHDHVPDHEIPERLDAAADQLIELRKQLARLGHERPDLVAIRAQALGLIDCGDMDGARDALRRGRYAARREASVHEAEFLVDEARLDSSELNFDAAAAKYAEASALVAPFDQQEGRKYLRQQAQALRDHAGRFGDDQPLLEAIRIYRHVLAAVPHAELPIEWAATHIELGNALRSLGKIEPIEEAIAACRAGLGELTPWDTPVEWVSAHICLGFAFWQLGCLRSSDTDRLEEEAIAAFRMALQECSAEQDPVRWSMIQTGLGNALAVRSWSDVGMERLEQSAAAFRQALTVLTRERAPQRWAGLQNNLANVLGWLGEHGGSTERLEEAVAACREALKEHTRERWPVNWAMSQVNLGRALRAIGEHERGTARLDEAVAAFREALKECERGSRTPLVASVRTEMGHALRLLGMRESGTVRLEEAVTAYQLAIEGLSPEREPHLRAGSIGGQGVALTHLAERTRKADMAQTAVLQIKTALEILRLDGPAWIIADFEQALIEAREILDRLEVDG